jgi:hypothetical protein
MVREEQDKMADTPYTGYFNVHKYSEGGDGATDSSSTFVSPTDYMADGDNGLGMVISFKHEPSGQSVFFKAFITSLNESYASDWAEESVYGRTDPIQLFKQTSRRISLAFKVPAETAGEAYDNLARISSLTQFLYPAYTSVGSAQTIAQGPVIRLKVMNLIAKSGHAKTQDEKELEEMDIAPKPSSFNGYKSNPDASMGLMGIITSLNINHNLESTDIGIIEHDINTILPTMIEVNLDFTVIHENALGWDSAKGFSDTLFPYNVTGMSADDAKGAADRLRAARASNVDTDDPANEQARLAAEARYLSLGGKARLKKDLKWLNRMANKQAAGKELTDRQKQNMEYLSETIAGGTGMAVEAFENMGGDISNKEFREGAADMYDLIDGE